MYAINGYTSGVLPPGVATLKWDIPTPLEYCIVYLTYCAGFKKVLKCLVLVQEFFVILHLKWCYGVKQVLPLFTV